MLKAVKVRIYPTSEQQSIISSQISGVRYIYNRTLALRKFAYQKFGKKVGKYDLIKYITKLKKRESTVWLKDVDSQALQQSVANMDKAYQHFFKGGGFPKFKSRHHSRQSYQYPQRVKVDGNRVFLPKVGWVKMRGFRKEFVGKIKTVTVSYEAYQYHVSMLIDMEDKSILKLNNKSIGLDVGVSLIVADSNGNKVKPLELTKELKILRLRAKQLSRKKKGSNNRQKAKSKLALANLKIVNKRKDFLHKLSTQYAENQSTVVVEDLKIKNMTKATKGTVETPAKNAKAKRGLNRSITQQSWGMFFELLDYKLRERGGELIKVNPRYTSQRCNSCGHIDKNNRQSQSKFVCTFCGHSTNADTNASKNILDLGIQGNNAYSKTKQDLVA